MAYVLKQYSKLYLWQTIQTKGVGLTAKELVNNHTSKRIKEEKQKRLKEENHLLQADVLLQVAVPQKLHPVDVALPVRRVLLLAEVQNQVEDLPVAEVLLVANKGLLDKRNN